MYLEELQCSLLVIAKMILGATEKRTSKRKLASIKMVVFFHILQNWAT
jgi:hypothetical protein